MRLFDPENSIRAVGPGANTGVTGCAVNNKIQALPVMFVVLKNNHLDIFLCVHESIRRYAVKDRSVYRYFI